MRPGQQQQNNKQRMRGRNNNPGRKGPNPLSRSFESNGPDVKIRGTAQHIADKYTTLARDAAASGDRVMAENYLQHAEHYGRIVAAAQGQFQPSQPERDYTDEDDDGMDGGDGLGAQPVAFAGNPTPQNNAPRFNDSPRQDGFRQDGPRQDGQGRQDRDGFREGRRNDRFGNRENGRDANRGEGGFGRGENAPRDAQGQRPVQGTGPQPYPRDAAEGGDEAQPSVPQESRENRREGRRDRQRFNDRSGERRFEERFGRPRGNDERAQESQPAGEGGEGQAASQGGGESHERGPVAEAAPHELAQPSAPDAGLADNAEQPRRRGRPRREAAAEVHAEQPSGLPEAPSTVSAGSEAARDEAAMAEPKRRAPRAAAPEGVEADGEAAPKRRPGRPRKKKADDEDGEVAPLPDFLLASNG